MVDPVANAGVADTLEARLADARKRHADGEYGTIPLLIVELGIRSQALGDNGCDGGRDCTDLWLLQVLARLDHRRTVARSTGPHHLEGVDRTSAGGRRAEGLRRRHSSNSVWGRCRATRGVSCSSLAHLHGHLEVLLAGGAAGAQELSRVTGRWSPGHFILSTYQVRDDLYIAQLEEKMTHIRMGEQESATDYCNRARRVLAEMRMAGAEYSTASYISHIVKGLPRGYNLMKRMMMVPGTHESLDKDSITSYILQDKAMQEAEQPTELLPQANYATPMKLNQQQGQCRKPSGGGRSREDVDEKRSKRDKGRGGGGRRQECWICHDPDHLSYECPDRDDSDEDDTKGGRGRSTSCRPRRDAKPGKEKQTSKKTSSTKDVDNSSGKSRGDGEASCSMVGVAEPTVSLALEAGENF
ncbi:unnamed protein product [Closterium sp. NIES-54]